jgi:hypothetical protein
MVEAKEYCKQKGGYLAAPEDEEDWQALADGLVDDSDGKHIKPSKILNQS